MPSFVALTDGFSSQNLKGPKRFDFTTRKRDFRVLLVESVKIARFIADRILK